MFSGTKSLKGEIIQMQTDFKKVDKFSMKLEKFTNFFRISTHVSKQLKDNFI